MELRPLRAQLAARCGRVAAGIGLYPICRSPEGSRVIVLPFALSGTLDDWNPEAPCVALANMPADRLMTVTVYPGSGRGAAPKTTSFAFPMSPSPHLLPRSSGPIARPLEGYG